MKIKWKIYLVVLGPIFAVGIFFYFLFSTRVFDPIIIDIKRSYYNDEYCYLVKEAGNLPIVTGETNIAKIDHPFISALNLPINLFERQWCIQDKSHINNERIDIFELQNDEPKEYECTPSGNVTFKQACFKAEFNASYTEFKFPHAFKYVCPTSYISDLERLGLKEDGQIYLEIKLVPKYLFWLILAAMGASALLLWPVLILYNKTVKSF